jgi:hypothetical protein
VALTSLLVASGIGIVGVAPALAASGPAAPAALHSDHVKDRGWGNHNRLFRDRGDFRYVWFRVCDGTATGAATTTTTAPDPAAPVTGTTTETVAPDALAAAVEGAAVDTATSTDAVPPVDTLTTGTLTTDTLPPDTLTTGTTTTGTTTTAPATVAADAPDAKAYPIFVVVPIPKDETKAIYKMDKRPCYDLTTGAPQLTDTTTTTTDATTTTTTPATATTTTTTVETPVGTVTG